MPFAMTFSQMGLNPLILIILITFTIFFPVAFIMISSNMDSKGLLDWMLDKPDNWIGRKK